jgi:hypothetical protein
MRTSLGEPLKPSRNDGHQVGDSGEIPVGISHLGMADVSGKRKYDVINIYALLIPLLNAVADKRVTEIMYPRKWMITTSNPPKLSSKALKDAMNSGLFEADSLRRDEEAIADVGDCSISRTSILA